MVHVVERVGVLDQAQLLQQVLDAGRRGSRRPRCSWRSAVHAGVRADEEGGWHEAPPHRRQRRLVDGRRHHRAGVVEAVLHLQWLRRHRRLYRHLLGRLHLQRGGQQLVRVEHGVAGSASAVAVCDGAGGKAHIRPVLLASQSRAGIRSRRPSGGERLSSRATAAAAVKQCRGDATPAEKPDGDSMRCSARGASGENVKRSSSSRADPDGGEVAPTDIDDEATDPAVEHGDPGTSSPQARIWSTPLGDGAWIVTVRSGDGGCTNSALAARDLPDRLA